MVRVARYVTDNFFLSPVLDEMVRNNEDVPHEPLCVPDDPLESIHVYPMEDIQLLLELVVDSSPGSPSPPPAPTSSAVQLTELSQREDTKEAARGRPKKKREENTTTVLRKRGRPRKHTGVNCSVAKPEKRERVVEKRERVVKDYLTNLDSLPADGESENATDVFHSRGIPKKKRNNTRRSHASHHAWSLNLPVLTLESSMQSSMQSSSERSSSSEDLSPESTEDLSPESTDASRRCARCMAEDTPQWRAGPDGPGTLCNACGIRYKTGRLML